MFNVFVDTFSVRVRNLLNLKKMCVFQINLNHFTIQRNMNLMMFMIFAVTSFGIDF